MDKVYPQDQIMYRRAGPHLIIGVDRFHSVPDGYIHVMQERLARLKGMKAQMDGVPHHKVVPSCIENVAMELMDGRPFEAISLVTPKRGSITSMLEAYDMPNELLEVYLAARHFEKVGHPKDPLTEASIARKVLKGEKDGEFRNIDIERGAKNYMRIAKEAEGGVTTINSFCEGCVGFVNDVWKYAIGGRDISEFVKRVGGSVGILVEYDLVLPVRDIFDAVKAGKRIEPPKHWQEYIDEEDGTMPISLVPAVDDVQKVISSPPPKVRLGTRFVRGITRALRLRKP